ncbi:MAG: hypothetical protein EZS28_043026, partial [Streblomastix strix]
SFNLKVQRLTKIISLTISDVARFADMNILVPRGHHDIEKDKEVFALRGKLYDYKIMYKTTTYLTQYQKLKEQKSMIQKDVEVVDEEENYREEGDEDFVDESADKIDKGAVIRNKRKQSEIENTKKG